MHAARIAGTRRAGCRATIDDALPKQTSGCWIISRRLSAAIPSQPRESRHFTLPAGRAPERDAVAGCIAPRGLADVDRAERGRRGSSSRRAAWSRLTLDVVRQTRTRLEALAERRRRLRRLRKRLRPSYRGRRPLSNGITCRSAARSGGERRLDAAGDDSRRRRAACPRVSHVRLLRRPSTADLVSLAARYSAQSSPWRSQARDPDEVRACRRGSPRSTASRKLATFLSSSDVPQLDLRCEVSDQVDAVHGTKVDRQSSRKSRGFPAVSQTRS